MSTLDLYGQYLAEREGAFLVARPWGFAVYKFEPYFVYLQDIYVVPAERKNGRGLELEHTVIEEALKNGYSHIVGSVVKSTSFGPQMHAIMLSLGYKEFREVDGTTYYIKAIFKESVNG
jgi:GNAT superfamily N-acetyltransferase